MTGLTQNVEAAAMVHAGTAAFGLGAGSLLGPSDLYRPLGLPPGLHQRPTATSTTPTSSEFHQHRSPFAIQQLLGLGQDEKPPPPSDVALVSAHRDDCVTLSVGKTKDYRHYQHHDRLR